MSILKDVQTKLTDERRAALKNEIVEHLERYDDYEAEKKERTKDLSEKMKLERREFTKKRKALRSGTIEESVECEEVQDFDRNEVRTVRCDNGETVASRAMRGEERQQSMEDIPEVQAAPAGKKTRLKEAKTEPKVQ